MIILIIIINIILLGGLPAIARPSYSPLIIIIIVIITIIVIIIIIIITMMLLGGLRGDREAVTTHLGADLQLPKHPLMNIIIVIIIIIIIIRPWPAFNWSSGTEDPLRVGG